MWYMLQPDRGILTEARILSWADDMVENGEMEPYDNIWEAVELMNETGEFTIRWGEDSDEY